MDADEGRGRPFSILGTGMPASKIRKYIAEPEHVDDAEPSSSIDGFCKLEDISPASYYKLRDKGLGPEEMRIPGTALIRITARARRQWQQRMAELASEHAAEMAEQAQARSARASHAGKLGAQSPLHVSKRGRAS
jgi:hypothetical protein